MTTCDVAGARAIRGSLALLKSKEPECGWGAKKNSFDAAGHRLLSPPDKPLGGQHPGTNIPKSSKRRRSVAGVLAPPIDPMKCTVACRWASRERLRGAQALYSIIAILLSSYMIYIDYMIYTML